MATISILLYVIVFSITLHELLMRVFNVLHDNKILAMKNEAQSSM